MFVKTAKCSLLLLFFLFVLHPGINARVLSGSRTERKMNRKIERLLKSARKEYDKGNVQPALDTYWKILEIDPQETIAYLELGEIYYELRIYSRAVELLEPGCEAAEREIDPETVSYYYSVLTKTYIELNQLGRAAKSLIKAAEAAPKIPLPRKILGDIYLANKRIKSAYKEYKKALSFDPTYEPALEKIAEMESTYKKELAAYQKTKIAKPAPKTKSPATKSKPDDQIEVSAIDKRPMPLPMSTEKPKKPQQPAKPARQKPESEPEPAPDKQPTRVAVTSRPKPTPKPVKQPTSKPVETNPAEIDWHLDKLLAGNLEEKQKATAFFVSLENEGLIEIEELLFDPDPEVRIIGVRTIAAFESHKPRAANILKDASDDPDPAVRQEIQNALKALN